MARHLRESYVQCPFIYPKPLSSRRCDFCGRKSGRPIAAPLDDVLGFIVQGLEFEWRDPNDEGIAWESADGGWQGEVLDTYDLLFDEILLPVENEQLQEKILSSLGDRQWCQRDYYELPDHLALIVSWKEFSKTVRYETRYVFLTAPAPRERYRGFKDIPPSEMLDKIGEVVQSVGLIKVLPKETRIFRVRSHSHLECLSTATQLGPPLPCLAVLSNRMSPAGIPMFYGALDSNTALQETKGTASPNDDIATLATFVILHDIKVLDLTALPEIPSLFDSVNLPNRSDIRFLHAFVSDLAKPISRDGLEHIEYIPTQIVTEYFRRVFRNEAGDAIMGIVYPSSKKSGGRSCVLFIQQAECIDDTQDAGKGARPVLKLLRFRRRTLLQQR